MFAREYRIPALLWPTSLRACLACGSVVDGVGVPLTWEAINGIVPYGVYLSDGVFAILRNVHIGPEQINFTSSVNVLLI